MTRDYKETLHLPKTNFPLHVKPGDFDFSEFIASCQKTVTGSVIHDGPPYSNGNLHIGHSLNKILKDITTRYTGDTGFRPGWDCHGLPIEWAVEKKLIEEGKSKNDLSTIEFRALCREFATHWVEVQKKQFKQLGVAADWDNPYLTMNFSSEAKVVSVLNQLAQRDLLYRGTKPVLWSVVEETALAEAEVEHKDMKSSQVWVEFPVRDFFSIPVWTTTPWTIPANLAIAYNSDLSYGLYEFTTNDDDFFTFVIADNCVEKFSQELSYKGYERIKDFDPASFDETVWHPFSRENDLDPGWAEANRWGETPLIDSKHVTDQMGTGFVHIAPEHGPEDFVAWNNTFAGGFENVVNPDGSYVDDMPMFGGMKVLQPTPKGDYIFEFTNAKIIAELERRGALLKTEKVSHSYPHSWRSKAPLIYRTTPQWFFKTSAIRAETLREASTLHYVPEHGRNRFMAAMETRPDWLISRQRVWGTPLALFIHKTNNTILKNAYVQNRLNQVFEEEGGDAWWKYENNFWFTGTSLNPEDYEKIMDVLDVWFDSGCSHLFKENDNRDIYLEGNDQHRGWFGSSMLINMAINGVSPFGTLITHGFVLKDTNKLIKPQKMSKSDGDALSPQVICDKHGPDVLRLWVASGDYTNDMTIGEEMLKYSSDMLRRFRNTFKYLLGNLDVFPHAPCDVSKFPELEKYILTRLFEVDTRVSEAYISFDYKKVCSAVMDFCVRDLSSFYFDVRKDVLYCDPYGSHTHIACTNTLHVIFAKLLEWLNPIIPFTVFEVHCYSNEWQKGSNWDAVIRDDQIKLRGFKEKSKSDVKWERVFEILDSVNIELEKAKRTKTIGSSMEAKITVYMPDPEVFSKLDAAEIFRVSQAEILQSEGTESDQVCLTLAEGNRCARSWKVLPEVGTNEKYPDLSIRDIAAIKEYDTRQFIVKRMLAKRAEREAKNEE